MSSGAIQGGGGGGDREKSESQQEETVVTDEELESEEETVKVYPVKTTSLKRKKEEVDTKCDQSESEEGQTSQPKKLKKSKTPFKWRIRDY